MPVIGLEIGLVPAASGQAKTRRRNLALECGLAALGAVGQRRCRHFLELLQFLAATAADIFINGHVSTSINGSFTNCNRPILPARRASASLCLRASPRDAVIRESGTANSLWLIYI